MTIKRVKPGWYSWYTVSWVLWMMGHISIYSERVSSQGTSGVKKVHCAWYISMNFRYGTSDRRIIGATVGYGAVSSGQKDLGTFLTCLASFFTDLLGSNYVRASTTSMVMGHLLARLAETVQQSIPTLKTFCIGISLGGQLCGFAGKDYRHVSK